MVWVVDSQTIDVIARSGKLAIANHDGDQVLIDFSYAHIPSQDADVMTAKEIFAACVPDIIKSAEAYLNAN